MHDLMLLAFLLGIGLNANTLLRLLRASKFQAERIDDAEKSIKEIVQSTNINFQNFHSYTATLERRIYELEDGTKNYH